MVTKIETSEEAFALAGISPIPLALGDVKLHWTDFEDTSNIIQLCVGAKKILEIGTFLGHTAENLGRKLPDSEITTIDVCLDMFNREDSRHQSHEILGRANSGSVIDATNVKHILITSDDFFAQNEELFDAILIDGDHSYDQVKKDSENAEKHLAPGGILIWHDVYNKDGSCPKCEAEPDFNDVREYLESREDTIYKIGTSWIGFKRC